MNTMTEKVADTESSPRRSLKRVAAAAAVGNFVEWFDSAAYAVMSVTIAKLFFPDYSTTASLLAVWAIFAGGFIARPLGAAFFGRYGDRIGRNKMLGLCVLIMSAATFCIGILPTFAVIGVWAPILLFLFRAVQGFTTGGEYTGSSAFIVEYAPEGKRATYASIIPATVGLASVAGALLGVAITSTLSTADLQAWGWRIPFLLAAPLGLDRAVHTINGGRHPGVPWSGEDGRSGKAAVGRCHPHVLPPNLHPLRIQHHQRHRLLPDEQLHDRVHDVEPRLFIGRINDHQRDHHAGVHGSLPAGRPCQ